MKHSVDRILTTHVGSLPRPVDLLDLMKSKVEGRDHDEVAYDQRVATAVRDCLHQQVACGIDVSTDGEQGKLGFQTYVTERLEGYEPRAGATDSSQFAAEVADFPEYYENYFGEAMHGGAITHIDPMVCTGPIRYRGAEAIARDIANLQAAAAQVEAEEIFMPAVAPSGVGGNEFYGSEEDYLQAVAAALETEYRAIVDAGFILQIDDPWLTVVHSDASLDPAERVRRAEIYVEVVNHSLRDIPAEKVRFHTCYGINEGPRVHDTPLRDIVDIILRVNAGAYSFEAATPRHEHEYHVWEGIDLPDGKILIPGVVAHASNIVEHPELIAERLVRFARLVGRERVIAGTDCGFSTQATYRTEVHPTVVWAKFRAMAEGARLATAQLW